jgi:hypothetical protein
LVDGGHIAFKRLGVALLLTACASAPQVGVHPAAVARIDVIATVLAAQLPSGASACAVAQPRWVAPTRRPLMLPLSTVDALVWRNAEIIDVYAEAQQRDRMGPGAAVRLIRFRGPLAGLRAYLTDNPTFGVRWDEPPSACRPDHCVVSARVVAPNVVRFDRGIWREGVSGAEANCVAMAREYPHAVEVSFRGPQEMAFAGGMVPLVASSTRIDTVGRTVRLVQRDRMDSVEAAQVLAEANVDLLHGRMGSFGGTRREQSGNVVISTTALTWDDLRISIDDRKRDSDNRGYAELLMALDPDDGIDPRDLTHALEQLRLRLALLEHEPTSDTLLTQTTALAERINIAHPNDADVARLIAKLRARRSLHVELDALGER